MDTDQQTPQLNADIPFANRVKGFFMSTQLLESIITLPAGSKFKIDQNDIPADASIVRGPIYLPDMDAFVVVLRHESFDEVPEGKTIPIHSQPLLIHQIVKKTKPGLDYPRYVSEILHGDENTPEESANMSQKESTSNETTDESEQKSDEAQLGDTQV